MWNANRTADASGLEAAFSDHAADGLLTELELLGQRSDAEIFLAGFAAACRFSVMRLIH